MGWLYVFQRGLYSGRVLQVYGEGNDALALAWALRDERVTSVLIGASSVDQLEDSAAAVANLRFSDAELEEIDRDAVEAGIDLWRSQSQVS